MKKERPILFSTKMVQSILDGSKSQTRRIKKEGIIYNENAIMEPAFKDAGIKTKRFPHGIPGDILWVREEHKIWSDDGKWWNCEYKDGVIQTLYYKAIPLETLERLAKRKTLGNWQRARFLPRVFSRTLLEITEVRTERLQEISEQDAKCEGFACLTKDGGTTYKYGIPESDGYPGPSAWVWQEWEVSPIQAFKKLWESINGSESWEQNPYVWAISFKTLHPQPATNY